MNNKKKYVPLEICLIGLAIIIMYTAVLVCITIPWERQNSYQKAVNATLSNLTLTNQTYEAGFKQGQINTTEIIVEQLYYAGVQCINITVKSPYQNPNGLFLPDITFVNRECK